MKKVKTVRASDLTLLKMVAGGEKKHRIVVDTDGILKEWVGFGWVNLREATKADRERWPRVVPKRETNATTRSRPKAKPRRK
jgi:hypothetical protein